MIRIADVEIDFSQPVSKDQLRRYRAQSDFVFQSHNLFPHKTVLQNITEGPLVVQKRSKDEVLPEAVALLDQVGLAAKKDQYPYELSGGQQQRVGIARALVIVTHEIQFARQVSDQVLFTDHGIILEKGTPEEVIGDPKEERTRQFLQRILNPL